ncbi:sigma-54-dependent Fis family transcriptional regulator [Idiomarina sp. OT37-5b]|jgi:two-component system response regulator FlrC|uniref:sigma-54-dependent transcriptional regulator n=1 Tax=Idiomarina sp. OT37-5b TaxID=2100422 RepID=UPI000CF85F33|nr:sigma-54 dependent transcriptional regulator [Idiomarina sp. OT37-5b]AVJ56619.1 sigma-54-dependent Fis family transcriptional regulator [Idiomarina sp. OT37-5b]
MVEAKILIVEDDAALREAIIDTLELADYCCLEADSGEAALVMLKQQPVDLIISDVQMPGIDGLQLLRSLNNQGIDVPVIVMTAFAKVDDAVIAMREGAIDYLSKPFSTETLLKLVQRQLPLTEQDQCSVVAEDPSSQALLEMAKKVAATDATVMITGPSGTGKEVLARYVHEQSNRKEQPFVAINCAAIPENMLESLLFGYEKGAFTGATQATPGKFELAQGGTILLDEITEMDINLQAKLLRVLQERQVERLGARKSIQLDVRVIATSNRDLKQAVAEGRFREDLLYRLNVFPLQWRALAERRKDIVPIAEALLVRHRQRLGIKQQVRFGSAAKQALEHYAWPGNIRELENVIQRALVLQNDGEIKPQDLMLELDLDSVFPEQIADSADSNPSELPSNTETVADGLGESMFHQEYKIIKQALQRHQGKRKPVAEELGISPRTLRYKLAKIRENGLPI